jgi:predicted AAA+ superfamily ATPase
MEQVIALLGARQEDVYFWGVHGQAELDLLVLKDGKRRGFEIKYADAPTFGRSMKTAMEDLKLDELIVVSPGDRVFQLHARARAIGLDALRAQLGA